MSGSAPRSKLFSLRKRPRPRALSQRPLLLEQENQAGLVEYFQQAIDKDPAYARAYAGLAEAYVLMGGYSGLPPTEFIPKARAAAQRDLELDERLPEAHTALAVIARTYDWDWPTAGKEYRRAIQLNPNYTTAHH